MAAPAGAYRSKSLFIRDASGNKEHLCAILQVDRATMLSRFYLDGIIALKQPDGTDGVVGAVIIGGTNETMHNVTTRGGVGRVRLPGGTARLLNDAGLNTYALASLASYITSWANHLRMNIDVLSAYYVNTDNVGIRYKKSTNPTWTSFMFGTTLPENNSTQITKFINPELTLGDTLQIQFITVNAEGTWYSPTINKVVDGRIAYFDALIRSSACSDVGEVVGEVWFMEADSNRLSTVTTSTQNTNIFAYKTETLTTKYANVWLMGLDSNKSFFVDANGQVTRYEECAASMPIASVGVEQEVGGDFKVFIFLSAVFSGNITFNGRIDVASQSTAFAKYFTITIPAGQQIGESAQTYNLSNGTYYLYDVTSDLPGQTIVVQSGPLN